MLVSVLHFNCYKSHPELVSGSQKARVIIHEILKQVQGDR